MFMDNVMEVLVGLEIMGRVILGRVGDDDDGWVGFKEADGLVVRVGRGLREGRIRGRQEGVGEGWDEGRVVGCVLGWLLGRIEGRVEGLAEGWMLG